MKQKLLLFSLLVVLVSCSKQESMDEMIDRVFYVAEQQYIEMDTRLDNKTMPQSIARDSTFKPSTIYWWCSGFYPGSLWYIYEYTQSDAVKLLAEKNTLKLDSIQYVTHDHDVGFQLNCSYGNGLRLTGNEDYRKVLYQGAKSLATRFNPLTGVIRSWDFVPKTRDWKYPVIIDNMMNLELLLWASKNSEHSDFASIARSHADITMKNHFRPDYSCYHVVSYDTITGKPDHKGTYQGYADDSDWSRGQGWALYGYVMMYRETKEKKYLEHAIQVAKFIINHPQLPEDKIPYWDFDDPDIPDTPRDASAGAVIASALIELSQYTKGRFSKECLSVAETQLRNLSSSKYLAEPGTNCDFILKHSVGNKPKKKEVDVPLTYADYYYVEALLRYKKDILKDKIGIEIKK